MYSKILLISTASYISLSQKRFFEITVVMIMRLLHIRNQNFCNILWFLSAPDAVLWLASHQLLLKNYFILFAYYMCLKWVCSFNIKFAVSCVSACKQILMCFSTQKYIGDSANIILLWILRLVSMTGYRLIVDGISNKLFASEIIPLVLLCTISEQNVWCGIVVIISW